MWPQRSLANQLPQDCAPARLRGHIMARDEHWPALPLGAWPYRDREAWSSARLAGDPLAPGGPASGLEPETCASMQRIYGQYLHWLH